jgi:hypothetical protein
LLTFNVDNCNVTAHSSPYQFFDEYGNICWGDEMARLDNFAIELQHDPNLIGIIIVYDGNLSCRDEAIARAIRARKYVVESRGVEWNRVIWRYSGHEEYLTTILQPIPRGAPELKVGAWLSLNEVNVINCRAKMYRRRQCGKS